MLNLVTLIKKIFIFLVVSFMAVTVGVASQKEKYIYTNYSSYPEFHSIWEGVAYIFDEHNTLIQAGDVIYDKNYNFYFINLEEIKKENNNTHHDKVFTLVRENLVLNLLGGDIQISEIEVKNKDRVSIYRYFISEARGVIAIALPFNETNSSFFWLKGRCGMLSKACK